MHYLALFAAKEKNQALPVKCLAHEGSIRYDYNNFERIGRK
jgi:hypothetical protein